jgi:hypothetical protein
MMFYSMVLHCSVAQTLRHSLLISKGQGSPKESIARMPERMAITCNKSYQDNEGEEMQTNSKIDENLDKVLKASGSALKHYTLQGNLERMRDVMRKIMSDAYIQGSNDCQKAFESWQDE